MGWLDIQNKGKLGFDSFFHLGGLQTRQRPFLIMTLQLFVIFYSRTSAHGIACVIGTSLSHVLIPVV